MQLEWYVRLTLPPIISTLTSRSNQLGFCYGYGSGSGIGRSWRHQQRINTGPIRVDRVR